MFYFNFGNEPEYEPEMEPEPIDDDESMGDFDLPGHYILSEDGTSFYVFPNQMQHQPGDALNLPMFTDSESEFGKKRRKKPVKKAAKKKKNKRS